MIFRLRKNNRKEGIGRQGHILLSKEKNASVSSAVNLKFSLYCEDCTIKAFQQKAIF